MNAKKNPVQAATLDGAVQFRNGSRGSNFTPRSIQEQPVRTEAEARTLANRYKRAAKDCWHDATREMLLGKARYFAGEPGP